MDKLLLQLAIAITLGGLLSLDPTIAQNYTPYQPGRILPPAKRAGHVEIIQGPALEFARDDLAIIRWTTNNPGGSDDHFAVIHYGTDPTKLSQTTKSHIRLNQGHSQTIFRVRVDGLHPQTTYYYTVTSMGSDGVSDGEEKRTSTGRAAMALLTQSGARVQLGGKLGQGMRPSAFRAERTAARAPMRWR